MCKTSHKLYIEVMTSLVIDGVAWWTGSGEPYRPLPVPDPKEDVLDVEATQGSDDAEDARIWRG